MTGPPDSHSPDSSETGPGALSMDAQRYLHHLEDWDISEDEKHEFLTIIWNLMVGFVDLGFRPDASRLVQHFSEQAATKQTHPGADDVNYRQSPKST
ncbi:hypothetical protein [Parvularcula sp. LCG005]|uniref:hypothetical protein n=1 Tax=Parvularcula sp. LCG005 TaxID=3078805 RepID=UPI002943B8B9|nr:hypothetical protein [Parvularcula sp. LCG005]WOI53000.1 hypothetical protein RUI03_12660 [Parvularcula sp. LCG005]